MTAAPAANNTTVDVYEVRCDNGVVKWRIALTDGVIVGATAAFADGP